MDTQTKGIQLPPGVHGNPVEANRFGPDDRWPKRNSIIVFPKETTVYRVAKAGSRRESLPSIYLVPVHEKPLEGKDGTAAVHYGPGSGYYSTTTYGLSQKGALIIDMGTYAAEEFVEEAIGRQIEEDRLAGEAAAAYYASPSGGVADRIADVVKSVEWRVREVHIEVTAIERHAADLAAELERLPQNFADELRTDIAAMGRAAENLRYEETRYGGIVNHLTTVVEMLREQSSNS